MPTQNPSPDPRVQNRGEERARTTDKDFTGAQRDAEKNSSDAPGSGTEEHKPADGDPQTSQAAELGHS